MEDLQEIKIQKDERYKWFVLQCIPSHENSTVSNLNQKFERLGLSDWIDTIEIPKEKVYKIDKNGKRVSKEKIMLPGYILIHMDISNGEILPNIKNTKGVVGWLNPSSGRVSQKPEVMRDSEAERFLNVEKEKAKESNLSYNFLLGENVKMKVGAFSGFVGSIEKLDDKKEKMGVNVKVFGRDVAVDVSYDEVEKA